MKKRAHRKCKWIDSVNEQARPQKIHSTEITSTEIYATPTSKLHQPITTLTTKLKNNKLKHPGGGGEPRSLREPLSYISTPQMNRRRK